MQTFCPPLGQPSAPPGSFQFHLKIPTQWFRPHLGVFLPGRVPKVSLGRRDGLGCLQWRRGVHVSLDPGGPSSSHVSNSCVEHTYLPFGDGFFGLYSIVAGWLFRQVALFRAFDLAGTVRGTKFRRSAYALFHLAICAHPPRFIPFASPFSSETSAGRRRLHRAFHGSNPWESSRRHCLGSVRGSQGQSFFLLFLRRFFHLPSLPSHASTSRLRPTIPSEWFSIACAPPSSTAANDFVFLSALRSPFQGFLSTTRFSFQMPR